MENQNKDNFNENWLDEVLGKQNTAKEISFDEAALNAAGLIHPDDAELERIVQETLAENWDDAEQEELSQDQPEAIPTQFFTPQEEAFQSAEPESEILEEVKKAMEAQEAAAPAEPPKPKKTATPKKAVQTKKKTTKEPKETDKDVSDVQENKSFLSKLWSGYGLFGIPHVLATLIWAVLIIAIGTWLGRTAWLCAADVLALGKTGQEVTISIDVQDRMPDIAEKLEKAGMIRYPKLFQMFAKFTGKGDNILVGSITFNETTIYDYNALINAMSYRGGSVVTVDIMIPEGYCCAQIFALLEEKGVCTAAELEEYAANGELDKYWFLDGVERGHKYCLEGYLFPDTYEFYMDDEPGRVLEKFLDNFNYRFTSRMVDKYMALNNKTGLNLTLQEVIIMASIVEKEKAADAEGYNISSVFYNRLVNAASYPYLNSDATILYATDYYNAGELNTREQINASPYNTYTQTGLPPTPIANPGLSSIDAALDPEDTDYFYFILDRSAGAHRFSRTLAEHQKLEKELGYT